MHKQGDPATMQDDPVYADVVGEVRDYLAGRIEACGKAGIDKGGASG
jgi:dihydropteroate synthase